MSAAAQGGRAVWLLLVGGAFLWSTNYVLALVLSDALSPLWITFLRWALGLPLLVAAAVVIERPSLRRVLRAWPWVVLTALTGLVGYNLLNYTALRFTGPTEAAVVNALNPLAIALLARLALGAALSRRTVVGIVISFAGVLVVVSGREATAGVAAGGAAGELLVLAAVACWAAYAVMGRRLGLKPITAVAAQALVAAVVTAPLALTSGAGTRDLTPMDGFALALLVLFPTCLAFVLWNVGAARVGPVRAGVVINLMPVFTAAMAFLAGLQRPSWPLIVGGSIVIAGLVVSGRSPRAQTRTALGRTTILGFRE